MPSASTVRRLPSVVESPRGNDVRNDNANDNPRNSHVPIIADSALKRKLTKEEEDLNIQNCDINEIEDNEINDAKDSNRFSSINGNVKDAKEWKTIENLKEGELFEDPIFPAVSKSLFYR